jgi:hypothetical protein
MMVFASAGVALAHKPIFVEPAANSAREKAVRISDPTVSWAIYAQLSQVGEVNYYSFTGTRGARVKIDVNIPRIESERDFGIALALIGVGLVDKGSGAPYETYADEGVIVAPDRLHDSTRIFDEPFTQTSYWTRQSLVAQLPEDGSYTIAVWNAREQTGKYVIAIGEREEFGIADMFNFPRIWLQVHSFFHESGKEFENAFGVLVLGSLVIVAGRAIERRLR